MDEDEQFIAIQVAVRDIHRLYVEAADQANVAAPYVPDLEALEDILSNLMGRVSHGS